MKYELLGPLRGAAALWVFFFHYPHSAASKVGFPFLHPLFALGHLGVPMFFVISGYCITASARSTLARGESIAGFLYRRALRIYPAFWCSIVLVVSLPFLMEGLSSIRTGHYSPPSPVDAPLRFLNFDWFDWVWVTTLAQVFRPTPGVSDLQAKFSAINAVYWTLALEVQFYAVMALALVCRSRIYWFLALTTVLSVPFLLWPAAHTVGIFLPYWPQFALGCALYWLLESGYTPDRLFGARSARVALGFNAGSGIAFGCWLASGWAVDPLAFAAVLSLLLWVNKVPRPTTARCPRPLRWLLACFSLLGLMSYSLYLLHGRLQYLVMQLTRQVLPADTIACDVATLLITCGLCYLFYLACEAPFLAVAQGRRAMARESRSLLSHAQIGGPNQTARASHSVA
jgi:peptidoglycan/LPS O-acetylase OafA/YrhL